LVEFDEGAGRPQRLPEFLTCNKRPSSGNQRFQNPEGLALERNYAAFFAQFSSDRVQLKEPKPQHTAVGRLIGHTKSPSLKDI
jgi:hypothetical protein